MDGIDITKSLWWFSSPLGLGSEGWWSAGDGEVGLEEVAKVGIRGSAPAGPGGEDLEKLDGGTFEREAGVVDGA